MERWYLQVPGAAPVGPMSSEEICQGIEGGMARPDALVSRVERPDWKPLTQVPQFAAALHRWISAHVSAEARMAVPRVGSQERVFSYDPRTGQVPSRSTVGQVIAEYLRTEPETSSVVFLLSQARWITTHHLVQSNPSLLPSRAGVLASSLVIAPIVLMTLHLIFFHGAGAMAAGLLFFIGCAAALILYSNDRLRTTPSLELWRAFWQRKPLAVVVSCVVLGLELVGIGQGTADVLLERRVKAMLDSPDACSALDPKLETEGRLSRELESAVGRKLESCRDQRRLSQERQREEQRALACATLADQLSRNEPATLPDGERAVDLGLLERAKAKNMSPGDLVIDRKNIPCAKSVDAERIWMVYVTAAEASPKAWAGDSLHVSDDLRTSLSARARLSPEARSALGAAVEKRATDALRPGKTIVDLMSASTDCGIAEGLKVTPGPQCQLVKTREQQLQAVEKAKAAQKEAMEKAREAQERAQDEARRARCERLVQQANDCFLRCPTEPDSVAQRCAERCGAASEAAGCE